MTWTGRRTTLELAVARIAEAELDVRRGVTVDRASRPGSVVRTDSGERLAADLVVDAMGRRSTAAETARRRPAGARGLRLPLLHALLPRPPARAARRAADAARQVLDSHVPGDAGTWCITLFASARDRALKRLRHVDHWTALVRACPRQAHWLDGEPITDVMAMGGVIDRYRSPAPAPGIVSVADAWACTNPSLGRGISLGLAHAALLRRTVREHGNDLTTHSRTRPSAS